MQLLIVRSTCEAAVPLAETCASERSAPLHILYLEPRLQQAAVPNSLGNEATNKQPSSIQLVFKSKDKLEILLSALL